MSENVPGNPSQPAIPDGHPLSPTWLDKPAYLLNVPFSLSAEIANNAWMTELDAPHRQVDANKAVNQFFQLYHFMAAEALVYLLPTPKAPPLQDLVYCANLGIVLDHLVERDVVVLSNFSVANRLPETEVGKTFFGAMGYEVLTPPYHFEGEAELKHLHDNVYLGGYGTRSDRRAYDWMAEQFDMRIVALEETEPYLYHLDCTVFPLTRETSLVCTGMYTREELAAIEQVTEIVDVSVDDCFSGICNSVRLGNILLNASNIQDMKPSDQYYEDEKRKNRALEDIAVRFGFEVAYFNLSEYLKSGALLSCMVMHLNRKSYDIVLL